MPNTTRKTLRLIVLTIAMALFAGSVLAAPENDLATVKSLGLRFGGG